MNKKFIIKKNYEIKKIIDLNNKIVNKLFIIYKDNNNLDYNRYCISINKKIGKANIRNNYKRKIKDILMKNKFNNSKDYVIIIRNSILNKNYWDIQNELLNVLKEK